MDTQKLQGYTDNCGVSSRFRQGLGGSVRVRWCGLHHLLRKLCKQTATYFYHFSTYKLNRQYGKNALANVRTRCSCMWVPPRVCRHRNVLPTSAPECYLPLLISPHLCHPMQLMVCARPKGGNQVLWLAAILCRCLGHICQFLAWK